MFSRILCLFFTVAIIVFLAWSLVGSYKNESHLTNNYLISFQISNLNLTTVFLTATQNLKRDLQGPYIRHIAKAESLKPSKTIEPRDIDIGSLTAIFPGQTAQESAGDILNSVYRSAASEIGINTASIQSDLAGAFSGVEPNSLLSQAEAFASTASIPDPIATLVSQVTGDIDSILQNIVSSAGPADLGFSDVYNVGFYGYCKGNMTGRVETAEDELGLFGAKFRNDNVNYTYCSPAKFGFRFDPLSLVKHEMLEQIETYANNTNPLLRGLTDQFYAELATVASSLTYDNLNLPGDLKEKLVLLNRLTVAGFSLLFAGTFLAFFSLLFQLVGFCWSPASGCLTFLNAIFLIIICIVVMLGAGLNTGVYMFVRRIVNRELDTFGISSYLSQQFYAFAWSAAVCSLLLVIFSSIGYIWGKIQSRRRRGKQREPEFQYDHKG